MKPGLRNFQSAHQRIANRPAGGAGSGRACEERARGRSRRAQRFAFVFVLLPVFCFAPAIVAAHEAADHYDRVHLSASAQKRVQNDIAIATLYAQEEGGDAAGLADRVNTRISEAVTLVEQHDVVQLQTSSYSTSPVYHNNKISGWRVRQSIRLESRDMALLSDLVGQLQQTLNLQNISFAVSPELKNSTDDELINEALKVFEQRAKNITQQLGRRDFRIVDIAIGNSVDHYPRRPFEAAVMSSAKVAAPSIESGEQTLEVTVSGQIELE